MSAKLPMDELKEAFGPALHENISMANYTTARVGGPVPVLISINSQEELVNAARTLWNLSIKFSVLGSGSNLLVSDHGLDRVILHNRAHNLKIDSAADLPFIIAEFRCNFGYSRPAVCPARPERNGMGGAGTGNGRRRGIWERRCARRRYVLQFEGGKDLARRKRD